MRSIFKGTAAKMVIMLVIIFSSLPSQAQDQSTIHSRLDSLYRVGKYDNLENFALSCLLDSVSLSSSEKAELHKYLGIIFIIRERELEGKQEFLKWLKLDPTGHIDSFRFPPKIVRIFQEAKDANKLSEADTQLNINDTWKYSPYNTISSLVIPGSGQLAQGKRQQGMSILLLQTVTLSGLIVSEYNFNLNSRAYHKATQPEEFDSKYDLANNWNKARWSFFAASVAIYVFAQAEFFLLPPNVSLSCGDCDPIDNISTVINPANDTLSPFVKLSVNF